ncbi:MAG: hypothetical protein LBK52_03075 [Deltaproteobacteria bacterium]|jgi:hypothetical protein|nr:hypothetical protein [Deltaproteobacteria bacterium]
MKWCQKKVIIPVLSCIATIIGISAIFFPSLFNFEKETFGAPVELTIATNDDLNNFLELLFKLDYEKSQIFKLDLAVCRIQDIPYTEENWFDDIYIQSDNLIQILVNTARPSWRNKPDTDELPAGIINLEGNTPLKKFPPNYSARCGEEESYVISGYFLPVEADYPHYGEALVVLKNVPIEQLKLKNY